MPRYEGYLMLADLLAGVPALRPRHVDVAFIDLANFGHWNSVYGQQRGDELLVLLTAQLRALPRSRTFRDGGDEFLVVGAPGATQLDEELDALFRGWRCVWHASFPDTPVVPLRAVISREGASDLRGARERQGRWIGRLKRDCPEPADEGVIRHYEIDRDGHWRYRDVDGTWRLADDAERS